MPRDVLPAYLPTYLPAYLPTCLPASLPAYLPTCLPACLPACLPTCLPAYLPTDLGPANRLASLWPRLIVRRVKKMKYCTEAVESTRTVRDVS